MNNILLLVTVKLHSIFCLTDPIISINIEVTVADSFWCIQFVCTFFNENIQTGGEMEQEIYVFDCIEGKKLVNQDRLIGSSWSSLLPRKTQLLIGQAYVAVVGSPPGVFVSACLTWPQSVAVDKKKWLSAALVEQGLNQFLAYLSWGIWMINITGHLRSTCPPTKGEQTNWNMKI